MLKKKSISCQMYINLATMGVCAPDFISHPENWKIFPLDNL